MGVGFGNGRSSGTLHFGSTGNTGTVVIGPGAFSGTPNTEGEVDVDFGTVSDGGGLGAITGDPNLLTFISTNATVKLNDNSTTINNLALNAGGSIIFPSI